MQLCISETDAFSLRTLVSQQPLYLGCLCQAISEVKLVDVPGERCETISQESEMFAAICYEKPFTLPLFHQTPDEAGDPLVGTIFQGQTWPGTLDPKNSVRKLHFDDLAICNKKIQFKHLLLRRRSRQPVTVSALHVPALPVLLHRYLCQKQTTILPLRQLRTHASPGHASATKPQ